MLKELSLHILVFDALEQMPGYNKFMKELVTNKRDVSFKEVVGLHHCSIVTSKSLT